MVVDGAVPSERHIAEELATLASLAVFVGADKPFCPALIREGLLGGQAHFGLAKVDAHRFGFFQRDLIDALKFFLLVFFLDFLLEHCQFLTEAGRGRYCERSEAECGLESSRASRVGD